MNASEYLIESVYNPNAFIVTGYPKNQMRPVNKPPIALSHDETLAVAAFLNTLGGTTDSKFVEQLKQAQAPWRKGLLKPDQIQEQETIPILHGDPTHGGNVFDKQGCLSCHRIGEDGREIGPDLTAIGASQTAQYILESIIDPSRVIVKGFKEVTVIWKDEDEDDLAGIPVAWIPNKQEPRTLRLNVEAEDEDEYGEYEEEGNEEDEDESETEAGAERIERIIDLSEVAYVGDTVVAVEIDDQFERYCGEYIEGDEKAGIVLSILNGGRWIKKRINPEGIEFVNYPMSPMPANFVEMLTPREMYDLIAYLMAQKGEK